MLHDELIAFLHRGGPALWAIAVLSVLTLALILWKFWDLLLLGAWSRRHAEAALADWRAGQGGAALARLERRQGLRAGMLRAAMRELAASGAGHAPEQAETRAREETLRVARAGLFRARRGLRALDLITTIAPLIGLLGTVLGMIEAFQALQEAGNRADPAALAGGIWQALLTTAAGMAVAIPAGVALAWFDSITERVQADMEDLATRLFLAQPVRQP